MAHVGSVLIAGAQLSHSFLTEPVDDLVRHSSAARVVSRIGIVGGNSPKLRAATLPRGSLDVLVDTEQE